MRTVRIERNVDHGDWDVLAWQPAGPWWDYSASFKQRWRAGFYAVRLWLVLAAPSFGRHTDRGGADG